MSDCPRCGMRDDDWFLCLRENCAAKPSTDKDARIAELEAENERLRQSASDADIVAKHFQSERDHLQECLEDVLEQQALSRTGAVEDAEAARDALRELANVKMDLSLEDWCRISNTILSALEPATPEDHKAASAASVDPDGIWERAYAETAGVQPDFLAGEQSGETGPGTPEARQDDEPVAWRYRWRAGGDWKLTFHFDNGLDPEKYEQEPLYTRPAEAMVDKVLDAAGDYMGAQYGNTALHHPTDRARIKAAMEAGRQALASSGGRK